VCFVSSRDSAEDRKLFFPAFRLKFNLRLKCVGTLRMVSLSQAAAYPP